MRYALLALLILIADSGPARADGKFFGRAKAKVGMPDQAALLRFADGHETLVIEPAFVGEGEEFAWLVPLPALPEVSPATSGLFPTLHELFLPEVRGEESNAFLVVLPFWLLSLIAAGIYWRDRNKVAMHWFLLIVALPFLVLCFLSLVLIVPKGLSAGLERGTLVHAHRIVGSYETATVSGDAVTEWLETNGFNVPEGVAPVLKGYTDEGWVVVAAKLRVDPETGREHRAHPLRFDFESDRAAYPLRLTGTGGDPLRLDLYVYGDRRAEAPGLQVVRAGDSIPLVHPGLKAIVDDAPFATKLSGTLSSEAMERDLEVSWSDLGEYDPVYYSPRAAGSLAANALLICIALNTAVLAWVVACGKIGRMGVLAWLAATVLASMLVAMGVRGLITTREVEHESPWATKILERSLAGLSDEYDDWNGVGLEEARRRIRDHLGDEFAIAEEDSPGHYVLRERDGRIEYVTFDRFGAPEPHRLGSKE